MYFSVKAVPFVLQSYSQSPILHDAIEGQMMEVKGVGKRTQLLDDLRNRRWCWGLKEEDEDRKRWKRAFIT